MITEDYVNFETAKLLKEKGFDEFTISYYSNDGLIGFMEVETRVSNGYQRPTLQKVMKWLREVHNIHIQLFRYPASIKSTESNEYYKPWYYDYTFLKGIDDIDIDQYGVRDKYDTYEEACEAAINYCLENLI